MTKEQTILLNVFYTRKMRLLARESLRKYTRLEGVCSGKFRVNATSEDVPVKCYEDLTEPQCPLCEEKNPLWKEYQFWQRKQAGALKKAIAAGKHISASAE